MRKGVENRTLIVLLIDKSVADDERRFQRGRYSDGEKKTYLKQLGTRLKQSINLTV